MLLQLVYVCIKFFSLLDVLFLQHTFDIKTETVPVIMINSSKSKILYFNIRDLRNKYSYKKRTQADLPFNIAAAYSTE